MQAAEPETTAYDLPTTEAAAYLRVHPDTLKRWVKTGKCRAYRMPSGRYRFRRSDLDGLIQVEAAS